MQIEAGAVESVAVAYVGGHDLHTDPYNYVNHLRGHETDSASIALYYQGLDFSDLIAKADMAYSIYYQVGIEEGAPPLPDALSLLQNYPNPFNAQTTISFTLPQAGEVRLDIYNILGERVATLCQGVLTAGWHKIIWDAEGLSSGIYLARLETDKGADKIKMVILK